MADNFLSLDGKPISFGGYFFKDDYWQHKVWNLNLQQNEYGLISADVLSGYDGDVVTLSNTPSAGYQFNSYGITGAELSGNQFAFSGSNVSAQANFEEAIYTLTLQTDGHGTLTANKVTGHAGDTVTLTPTYNTYYRFSAYAQTGGSINGNTFTFGNQNATAKANFKVNAFTATGNWDKGSNVNDVERGANRSKKYTSTNLYIKHVAHTGDVPTSWYSTSNRWKPTNTNISGYKITLKPSLKLYTQGNESQTRSVTAYRGTTSIGTYSPGNNTQWSTTISQTTLNVDYSIKFYMYGSNGNQTTATAGVTYSTASNTGTWTATGYAP